MNLRLLPLFLLSLSLAAQTYDVRLEAPFPRGQDLPNTLLIGTGQRVSGTLDTGRGGILTVQRTFLEWPVLRLSGAVEATSFQAHGQVNEGADTHSTRLSQTGLGVGLEAQLWIPFTGIAGEMGLIQRLQQYRFEAAGTTQSHDLSRTWVRVGLRWRLPIPALRPYLAVSYQEPLANANPVQVASASDLPAYLATQGSRLEVQRLWTLGVGVVF